MVFRGRYLGSSAFSHFNTFGFSNWGAMSTWRSHVTVLLMSPVFLGRDFCVCWDGHLLQFYLIDFLMTTLFLKAQSPGPLREEKRSHIAVVTAVTLEDSLF
jgi:hypothetical protein